MTRFQQMGMRSIMSLKPTQGSLIRFMPVDIIIVLGKCKAQQKTQTYESRYHQYCKKSGAHEFVSPVRKFHNLF